MNYYNIRTEKIFEKEKNGNGNGYFYMKKDYCIFLEKLASENH